MDNLRMSVLSAIVVLSASVAVATAVDGKKFESIPTGNVSFKSFVPDRDDALYAPGDSVTFRLHGSSSNAVEAVLTAVDFNGCAIPGSSRVALPAGEFDVACDFPAPKAYGHFTVTATLTNRGRPLGYTQSSFVTAPPEPAKRDPFFIIDKNYAMRPLVRAQKQLGFGTLFFLMPGVEFVVTTTPEERERYYASMAPAKRTGNLALSKEFCFIGAFDPDVKRIDYVQKRLEKGLASLSDEDLLATREHARRMAEVFSDVISTWIVQEEFDGPFDRKIADEFPHNLSAFALAAENAYIGLKQGNPNCRVGVLGICGDDYLLYNPRLRYSRIVLASLRGHFDFAAFDAYSGNWNHALGPYVPPEALLRPMLVDGAALSAEYGGARECLNVERCYSLDYAAAFDSLFCRQHAVLTARSMIVNRAVKESPGYSLHLATYPTRADEYLKDPAKYLYRGAKLYDIGLWKTVRETPQGDDGTWRWKPGLEEPTGDERYVPRPTLPAAGTVARELAFVTDPADLALASDAHACVFTREADRLPVAALWTTNGTRRVTLEMPNDGVRTDLMGNAATFKAGPLVLDLDDAPVFLRCACPRTDFDRLLETLR